MPLLQLQRQHHGWLGGLPWGPAQAMYGFWPRHFCWLDGAAAAAAAAGGHVAALHQEQTNFACHKKGHWQARMVRGSPRSLAIPC